MTEGVSSADNIAPVIDSKSWSESLSAQFRRMAYTIFRGLRSPWVDVQSFRNGWGGSAQVKRDGLGRIYWRGVINRTGTPVDGETICNIDTWAAPLASLDLIVLTSAGLGHIRVEPTRLAWSTVGVVGGSSAVYLETLNSYEASNA